MATYDQTEILWDKYKNVPDAYPGSSYLANQAVGNAFPQIVSTSQTWNSFIPATAPTDFGGLAVIFPNGSYQESTAYPWIRKYTVTMGAIQAPGISYWYASTDVNLPLTTNVCRDTIPFNFDPFGSYNVQVFANNIPVSPTYIPYPWNYDESAGVLTFYPQSFSVLPPTPITMIYYRYVGKKGGGGTLNYWTITDPPPGDTLYFIPEGGSGLYSFAISNGGFIRTIGRNDLNTNSSEAIPLDYPIIRSNTLPFLYSPTTAGTPFNTFVSQVVRPGGSNIYDITVEISGFNQFSRTVTITTLASLNFVLTAVAGATFPTTFTERITIASESATINGAAFTGYTLTTPGIGVTYNFFQTAISSWSCYFPAAQLTWVITPNNNGIEINTYVFTVDFTQNQPTLTGVSAVASTNFDGSFITLNGTSTLQSFIRNSGGGLLTTSSPVSSPTLLTTTRSGTNNLRINNNVLVSASTLQTTLTTANTDYYLLLGATSASSGVSGRQVFNASTITFNASTNLLTVGGQVEINDLITINDRLVANSWVYLQAYNNIFYCVRVISGTTYTLFSAVPSGLTVPNTVYTSYLEVGGGNKYPNARTLASFLNYAPPGWTNIQLGGDNIDYKSWFMGVYITALGSTTYFSLAPYGVGQQSCWYVDQLGTTRQNGTAFAVTFTSTSCKHRKENIEDLDTTYCVDFINKLKPKRYKFKRGIHLNDKGEDRVPQSESDKIHFGFLAQDVEEDCCCDEKLGIHHKPDCDAQKNESQGLAYQEIIAPLVKTVQDLLKRVAYLEEQLKNKSNL